MRLILSKKQQQQQLLLLSANYILNDFFFLLNTIELSSDQYISTVISLSLITPS